jgi:3-(3-hydroxy-phenyl)propionate hydroxylase
MQTLSASDATLIAGGGPVGMTAALALTRRGIPVRIFEAAPSFASDPRASSIHPSTMDMLEELGLNDVITRRGLRVESWQFWDRVEGPIIELEFAELRDYTRHPYRTQFEQHNLCGVIADELLRTFGVPVHFGAKVTFVRQDDAGVEVQVETAAGAERIHGRFLIAADGGRSGLRKQLGVAFDGYSLQELFVVVTTAYDFSVHGYANACHFADPDEWATLFRVPNEGGEPLWRISMPATVHLDEVKARDFEVCSTRLGVLLPPGIRPVILHSNLYGVHQRVAERFRVGRVLLAGDAAHVNGPTGAMGMNFGIQDAMFLAEQLSRVYADPANTGPLDRYDRQRRTLAEAVLQKVPVEIKARLEMRDIEARKRRNDTMRELRWNDERRLKFLLANAMIDSVRASAAIE